MKYIEVTCCIDCPFSRPNMYMKLCCHHPEYMEAEKGYPEISKDIFYGNKIATDICKLPDLKKGAKDENEV